MSIIPEVKCRRCGEAFSSLRSSCPNCGTRRVAQSSRNPSTTPGAVKGTAAYDRAEANTKWQMIFGLILVVAVILAVIIMVSTSLNGSETSASTTPAPPVAPESAAPTPEPPPTPTPTPTPDVELVQITYMTKETQEFTEGINEDPVPLEALVYPLSIQADVTWTSSDPEFVAVLPDPNEPDNSRKVVIDVLQHQAGGFKITAECGGKTAEVLVYTKDDTK